MKYIIKGYARLQVSVVVEAKDAEEARVLGFSEIPKTAVMAQSYLSAENIETEILTVEASHNVRSTSS